MKPSFQQKMVRNKKNPNFNHNQACYSYLKWRTFFVYKKRKNMRIYVEKFFSNIEGEEYAKHHIHGTAC